MELDKSNLNFQAKTQELFGENQILLHENNKLIKERNDYKQQRDELIKDVEKLREEKENLGDDYVMVNGDCMYWKDKLNWLNEQYDELLNKYTNLTEHIKDKALHNPSVSRYIDLVHVIDELERE